MLSRILTSARRAANIDQHRAAAGWLRSLTRRPTTTTAGDAAAAGLPVVEIDAADLRRREAREAWSFYVLAAAFGGAAVWYIDTAHGSVWAGWTTLGWAGFLALVGLVHAARAWRAEHPSAAAREFWGNPAAWIPSPF